jgi:hypothetical protein
MTLRLASAARDFLLELFFAFCYKAVDAVRNLTVFENSNAL